MTAQPEEPAEPAENGAHEVIHLGGQAAVIVPLGEYRILKALRDNATPDAVELAEMDAAVSALADDPRNGLGVLVKLPAAAHTGRMRAQDEHSAGIDGTTPGRPRSDFEKAGGLWPLLICGTVLSVITWLPFMHGPVSFWVIWLAWCGPVLLFTGIAARCGKPRSAGLPAECPRHEQRITTRSPRPF